MYACDARSTSTVGQIHRSDGCTTNIPGRGELNQDGASPLLDAPVPVTGNASRSRSDVTNLGMDSGDIVQTWVRKTCSLECTQGQKAGGHRSRLIMSYTDLEET